MKTIIATASASLFFLAAAAPAFADDIGSPPTAVVSYADLDLGHPQGRAVLERRVGNAVAQVCPAANRAAELALAARAHTCREAAWSAAQRQLAMIYRGRQLAEADVILTATR